MSEDLKSGKAPLEIQIERTIAWIATVGDACTLAKILEAALDRVYELRKQADAQKTAEEWFRLKTLAPGRKVWVKETQKWVMDRTLGEYTLRTTPARTLFVRQVHNGRKHRGVFCAPDMAVCSGKSWVWVDAKMIRTGRARILPEAEAASAAAPEA